MKQFTMRCRTFLFLLTTDLVVTTINCHFNPFMDSESFSIYWAGHESSKSDDELLATEEASSVYITTVNKEKYRCSLPSVSTESDEDEGLENVESFELDLLKPLFEQTSCTYRLETYWTYELCHGKHLRQYHEEKELGKKTKLTEYYLGRYDMETFWEDYNSAKAELAEGRTNVNDYHYNRKTVLGVEIPFYEVIFDQGTMCDLTGIPRRSAIHYVCQSDGHGEIYATKETSSCEYEVTVATSLLCSHPVYGPKKDVVNAIQCHALDDSPLRPKGLDVFDNPRERFNSKEEPESRELPKPEPLPPDLKHKHIGEQTDKEIMQSFLTGDFCVHGGSGWWKYEFCYGKHVKQYHEERNSKVVILLGEWDTASQLLWINNNPKKRPAAVGLRKSIYHFYANGHICDVTGKNRVVEVRMTCVQNSSTNQHSMSVYLIEPKTCQYKLVVESPLLCAVIDQANADGLVPVPDQ